MSTTDPSLDACLQHGPAADTEVNAASQPERFDAVILGSGQGGKPLAWHLGRAGRRVAVVERRWVGG